MSISRSIREQVRQRAQDRCEYCRLPAIMSKFPHHIDHIIPIKQLGTSDLDNLAWSCFECNTSKGSNVAAYDPDSRVIVPLFNPRKHNWNDHFALKSLHIVGKTPIGRATVHLLNMNIPDQIDARRALINTGQW